MEINGSIDGTGKVNEYIRAPSKSRTVDRSLKFLDERSQENLHIYIHSAFQALNLFNIPDFLQWAAGEAWRKIHRMPRFIWLEHPDWLQAAVLPEDLKSKAIAGIEKAIEETEPVFMSYNKFHGVWSESCLKALKGFINRLKSAPWKEAQGARFVHHTAAMDRFRKEDVTQVMPELKELFSASSLRAAGPASAAASAGVSPAPAGAAFGSGASSDFA